VKVRRSRAPQRFRSLPQRVLLTLKNTTREKQTVSVERNDFRPASPRLLRARSGTFRGHSSWIVARRRRHAEVSYRGRPPPAAGSVAPTGVSKSPADEVAALRGAVRSTTSDAVNLPPGVAHLWTHPEDVWTRIRSDRTWFYGDGIFRVRAPAAGSNLMVRKGLEYRSLNWKWRSRRAGLRRSDRAARWSDMPARVVPGGWHLHYFDPPSVRSKCEAEMLPWRMSS